MSNNTDIVKLDEMLPLERYLSNFGDYALNLGNFRLSISEMCKKSSKIKLDSYNSNAVLYSNSNNELELWRGTANIKFQDHSLVWVKAGFNVDNFDSSHDFIVSRNIKILEELNSEFVKLCKLDAQSIYIYDKNWQVIPDEYILDLKSCTWDKIILDANIKKEIINETDAFLSGKQKEIYDSLSIPYKRGFMLIGPPGCGKTLTMKIIANTCGVPYIFVKELHPNDPSGSLRTIYEIAKENAPCIVGFEDIDSLLRKTQLRTEFLNTLDGITSYQGILTIATANNPEQIDIALLNRPSRFDRKWPFKYPEKSMRMEYMINKLNKIYGSDLVDNCKNALKAIEKDNHPYGYSMLQELVISAAYIEKTSNVTLSEALIEAHESIKKQIDYSDANKVTEAIEEAETPKVGMGFLGAACNPKVVELT